MASESERGRTPNARQSEWIQRIGQKAADTASAGKREFTPLGFVDRIKLEINPHFKPLIQRAIHEACLESGHDTQSYIPTKDRSDSMSPHDSLTVRVTQIDGVLGLPVVKEGYLIPGSRGYAPVDVYPPED